MQVMYIPADLFDSAPPAARGRGCSRIIMNAEKVAIGPGRQAGDVGFAIRFRFNAHAISKQVRSLSTMTGPAVIR